MDLFKAIESRKSIRKFKDDNIPDDIMNKAFEAAILAPNSSNLQTWNFYWIQNSEKKKKLIQYCLNQSAARTAKELVVVEANPDLWKRSLPEIQEYAKSVNAPSPVMTYYTKLVPYFYRSGWFNLLGFPKSMLSRAIALFKPMMRGPHLVSELQEVAVKSAALAAENFVLAMTAQGYASCMMEGFDSKRVKTLLKLNRRSKVVMVIALGKEAERGTWGPRFRLDQSKVVHRV